MTSLAKKINDIQIQLAKNAKLDEFEREAKRLATDKEAQEIIANILRREAEMQNEKT